MANDRRKTIKQTLKSLAAVLLALLIIYSAAAIGTTNAFAAGETEIPQQTLSPESSGQPQPSTEPDAGVSQPAAEPGIDAGDMQITQADGKDCVEGEVIVKFKDSVSDAGVDSALNSVESDAVQQLPSDNLVVTQVPEGETVEGFIDTVEAMPGVEYAQPNYVYDLVEPDTNMLSDGSTEAAATDPLAGNQWYLNTIHVYDAWDITAGSPNVRVAVLDTGVDLDHPDLAGQIVAQADVVDYDGNADDDYGHGTHVAGIIAAKANNGVGVAGVAPGVKLIAVDVFTKYNDGSGDKWGALTSDIIEGITYARDNGADVINLSLGSYDSDPAFEQAITNAASSGVTVVCAAGNDNTTNPHYPSDYDASISVIATNWSDTRASYSNYGAAKDISAPGGDSESNPYWDSYIISTYNNGGYVGMSGTSMAAPVVSGVVALMISADPGLGVTQIKNILYNTAADLGAAGKDNEYGYGRVDAYQAVAAACTVVRVSSVNLTSKSANMEPGNTVTLGATVLPADATHPEVVWSSSNTSVAAVDQTGKVTAVGGGNAVITATADSISDTCSVAVTAPEVTVAFESRGGSPVQSVVVAWGSSVASPSTYMTGYTFAGWYPTPECNTAPVSFPFTATGSMTLYAKWTINYYTVSFNSQGGSAVSPQTVAYNNGIYQPAAPYMSGYAFGGWYREPNCITPWWFGYDSVQSDITLYAKWQGMGPYLANVSLSAGSLSAPFSRTSYSYKIYLGENEPGITITPEKEYAGASMTINGRAAGSITLSLANGKSVTVTVKTKYGKTAKTYKFTVLRAKSTNNNLASLAVSAGALSQPFDPNVTNYTLYLDENTKSAALRAYAANSMARVSPSSSKISLNNGQSKTVRISVRAQSGVSKTYVVTVVRAASANANLKSLKASYMSPGFNPNVTNYSVTMPANKGSVSISVKPAGYKAVVFIDGVKRSSVNVALANGQSTVVLVTAAAQAGNTKEYYITVSRL